MNTHKLLYACALVLPGTLLAQQDVMLDVDGHSAADHTLTWNTELGFNYHIFASTDLQNWTDTGIVEPGCDGPVTFRVIAQPTAPEELFYQIRASAGSAFLLQPCQGEEFGLVDGVCFAFDLNVLSQLPDRIRIHRRDWTSGGGAPWTLIGTVREFVDDQVNGIRYVRGSVIWIPDQEGEFEVRAQAVDAAGAELDSAIRRVVVVANQPPLVTITAGPAPLPAQHTVPQSLSTLLAQVTDPDGDLIRRVEFFDNGQFIGTDFAAPFGDNLVSVGNSTVITGLVRITDGAGATVDHNLTAKAYDSRGGVGDTPSPWVVRITDDNRRPEVQITSPPDGEVVDRAANPFLTIEYQVTDPDGSSDLQSVTALDHFGNTLQTKSAPFNDFSIDTTGWRTGSHTIYLRATDFGGDPLFFDFFRDSYARSVQIFVDSSDLVFAQNLVANIVEPQQPLAQSNETFTGINLSSAEITGAAALGLAFDEGIVMTSGAAEFWDDPNLEPNASEVQILGFPDEMELGDPQLEDRILGVRTLDAAALEFDLFCQNGQLEFEYIFGSEEYEEFVGEFNDAFIILVDDVVVSLLPDCTDIVTVNTVSNVAPFDANSHLYINDPGGVEYNGITVALRIHALVEPTTTHRVKIVIADTDGDNTDDHVRDSALFIQRDSVRTINPLP